MRTMKRRAAITAAGLAAAVGVSVLGAGAASAASGGFTPRQGVMGDGSYRACLEYGNTMAQMGALRGFTCTPQADGRYYFRWY
ncbi:hypothetical protein G3260_004370 [Streptomyces albus]|uniref:Uncharacterized protein n=2 Tax=Streptomyces TaxID=1883 RepID=A0A6C1C6B0_9ACTN|nr:hypothetical protein HMPREF1486_02458 [Streptomyces sp. HPH0547]KPC92066.1 hypothetical protein ADL27_28300 [Streptomyces sp. NRRL F-6602]QID37850.1 hypothetical protein G3260_004370 [Streptomyces albus]TGG75726.1 hypothetical protein D8771_32545 [Streptomyces albus]GHJ19474.1 hypothetical protein TPA0909_10880 [Streptomyces albus]